MWVRGCTTTLMLRRVYRSYHTLITRINRLRIRTSKREEYLEWQQMYGKLEIDWAALSLHEREDNTSGSRELACTAGVCEVVDLNAA